MAKNKFTKALKSDIKKAKKELKPLESDTLKIEEVDLRHETVKDKLKQQSLQEKLKAAGLGNKKRNKRRHVLKEKK